jgi:hypothetical protein
MKINQEELQQALYTSIYKGNVNMFRLLVSGGADINKSNHENTYLSATYLTPVPPIIYAIFQAKFDIIMEMLKYDINLNFTYENPYGDFTREETPLDTLLFWRAKLKKGRDEIVPGGHSRKKWDTIIEKVQDSIDEFVKKGAVKKSFKEEVDE